MQELAEEPGIVLPLGRRVAEHLLDLRADVRDRAAVVRRRDQGDERKRLDEGAVPALGLVHAFGPVGDDRARGDDSAVVANRDQRHRDDELLAVPSSLAEVAAIDALALRHSLEGREDVRGVLLRAEEGDVGVRDIRLGMAVDPLGPSVPGQDVALEVEPDDRLGLVPPDRVQLTRVASALSFGAAQAVGREPGQDRRSEPDGQGDERPRRVIDREDEEERPACGCDESAPARPDEKRDGGCDQERQRSRGLRRVEQRERNRGGSLEHEADQSHDPGVRSEPLGRQTHGAAVVVFGELNKFGRESENPSRCARPSPRGHSGSCVTASMLLPSGSRAYAP